MRSHFLIIILKKIFEFFAALFFLVCLSFFLLRVLPGSPFDQETHLNPTVKDKLEAMWHLQDSVSLQFFNYVSHIVQGDLGVSMIQPQKSVSAIIYSALGATLWLNIIVLFFVYAGAFFSAFVQAFYLESLWGYVIEQVTLMVISLPSLFVGPLLIYFFGFYLNLLPIAFLTSPWHFILPVLALSLRPMASLSRLLQKSIQEQLRADYVRAAKAKGMSRSHLLYAHVFKNSLIPALSFSGPLILSIFSGSVLVEILFSIPGIGSEFIVSLNERDYTLMSGIILIYGILLICFNMLIDILMRQIDPRMSESLA